MDVIEKASSCRSERQLIDFAKSDRCSKAELSELIDAIAQRQRQRGESREQAFTKFICDDPLGRDLYRIMKSSAGFDHYQLATIAKAIAPSGGADLQQSPAFSELQSLAENFRKSADGAGLAKEQAFAVVADTAKGRSLMARDKAYRMQTAWRQGRRYRRDGVALTEL